LLLLLLLDLGVVGVVGCGERCSFGARGRFAANAIAGGGRRALAGPVGQVAGQQQGQQLGGAE
jgi:hypothetical protein